MTNSPAKAKLARMRALSSATQGSVPDTPPTHSCGDDVRGPRRPDAALSNTNMTEAEVSAGLEEILNTVAQLTSVNSGGTSTSPLQTLGTSGGGGPTISFRHPEALELIHDKLRSNGFANSRIGIEYYPDQGHVRFKMPEGVVHSTLHRKFNELMRKATRDKLSHLEELSGSASPLLGDDGAQGQIFPDQGWSSHATDPWARLVLEVAVSQAIGDLENKCRQHVRNGEHVQAAIGVKVPYNQSDATAYEAILQRIEECYVGL
ncbi:hypothetical protein EsH8_XV_000012 [Colletotrichum jinshuiense]